MTVIIRKKDHCYTKFDLPTAEARNDYFDDTPSLTRQSAKDECDVNQILARYQKTGVLTHLNPATPMYADLSEMPNSYQDALEFIRKAQEDFQNMSSTLRAKFQNDPQQLINFIANPSNYEEAAQLGLLDPEKLGEYRKLQTINKEALEKAELEKHVAITKKLDQNKIK